MDLIDILRHTEPPRTEYFVEVPSEYGKLRLDILGGVGEALAQAGMTAESVQAADDLIEKAQVKVQAGERQAGLSDLMEVAKRYPYSLQGYEALYNYYWDEGNPGETIFCARQMIALAPRYTFLTLLGKALGRAGRYDEALPLQAHLWETRQKATSEEVRAAVHDYLVTLGRAGDGKKMVDVAGQAIREMGSESTLVYQYIYGHILEKQYTKARELLNQTLPSLKADDPLYTRFMEMSNLVDDLLEG